MLWACLPLLLLACHGWAAPLVLEDANHRIAIEPDGFRFQIEDKQTGRVVPAHPTCGLTLNGAPVRTVAPGPAANTFGVTATNGATAEVSVVLADGVAALTVTPRQAGRHTIALSLGGLPVAYGLGDAGGWSGNLNLVRDKATRYSLVHNGGPQRWLSSFVVFPGKQLAGVVFDGSDRAVTLGPDAYTMRVAADASATFYYLLGDMPRIYRSYRALRSSHGFAQPKPKFRLFELGWESWAALGYQTRAETVLRSISAFQDNGYPIRWAVTGSGFWEEGGTTTSFGKFGKKFPDPAAFKDALHKRDVKWLIGLRTNFTLPGGPHIPKSKKRDFNLKGTFFHGNPLSTVGVERDYFLKDRDGALIQKTSQWFPIVPCYLLDGRKPEAVDWYAGLYQKWAVDGIKEDTMMNLGGNLTDIYDGPVSRLAEDGALVMARCGSFSAGGTLLRINDTHVPDMSKRTPINYLQYAASGAPNVYSDTIGFRKMKHYSEAVVRHGWLMALTAGLAVAEVPFAWKSEYQARFKKPIDFHYRLGPYLYDAAVKSYKTGYPYTMTPLGIAYPTYREAAEPAHYQWLAGESLLCTPLVKDYKSGKMNIVLPPGTWYDYDSGERFRGPKVLRDFPMPVGKTPVFVGGAGIVVLRSSDEAPLQAHVYPVDQPVDSFTFYHPDGESTSILLRRKRTDVGVWDAQTEQAIPFSQSPKTGALSFPIHANQTVTYSLMAHTPQPTDQTTASQESEVNWATAASVTASSQRKDCPADNIKDGVISDKSRWLAAQDDPAPWVQLTFSQPTTIAMIDVFSGWKNEAALADYDISVEIAGAWESHGDWQMRGNTANTNRIYIERQQVTKLRLSLLKPGPARIREIAAYSTKEVLGLTDQRKSGQLRMPTIDMGQHQIAVNQVGYLSNRPKRFTAPLSADGTPFVIRTDIPRGQPLYRGEIQNGIGDFSDFTPADSATRYVIDITEGNLKPNTSDAFLIRTNLAQEQYWQAAVDFLIDVRSVTGTHPSAYGGCAWRDGTYYDAIVPALVKFYLADSAYIEAMPRQIDWQADKARVMAPDFPFDAKNPCSDGVLAAARAYYQLDPPAPEAPDVVKLIHWGAGYILMKPNGRDPSSQADRAGRVEPQTVEQVAYVLWAWPALKKWLPQSFYERCRDFCFRYWSLSSTQQGGSSLDISPFWDSKSYMTTEAFEESMHAPGDMHPFKGRHAVGHSIVPNLLMHEVALREGRSGAATYLDAAVKQSAWIIDNVDWHDPRTSKGHRLSEHRTIPNLVWLLQKYPNQAPTGLKAKIIEWAEIAVSRSGNLWDFRRYDDTRWTIPGMNEVGNSLGLPAICIAASWVVEDATLKARLEQLAFASIDHVFGRNPMLSAAPSHPRQGFPEVERGWPRHYKLDVCARLETVRGNIASLPGSGMYPFRPGKDFRHPEGWCNYGASWCISLSYLQFDAEQTPPDFPQN